MTVSFPAGAKRRGRESTRVLDAMDPLPSLRSPGMTGCLRNDLDQGDLRDAAGVEGGEVDI
jgi:hypothetical protein